MNRGVGGPRQRWMRCAHAESMGECAVTSLADITLCAPFILPHQNSLHQNLSLRLARFTGARQHFIADEICHTSRSDVLHPSLRDTFPSIHCDLRSSGEGSGTFDAISVQTLFVLRNFPLSLFPLRTILSREARPVISAKANMSFLIERKSSVQSGDF